MPPNRAHTPTCTAAACPTAPRLAWILPALLSSALAACAGTTPAPAATEAAPSLATQPIAVEPGSSLDRVVAVGDLHGDLDNALATLRMAGVVDEAGHWAGGTTTLVQTGDVTDRGPDSRALLDLLRRLETEAPQSGGRVVALLGNHEVMNLTGDWRYVHPGDVAAFGGEQARRDALALDGDYGGWLSERPVAAKVGDAVFVHGGIRADFAKDGLDALNLSVRDSLAGTAPPARRQAVLGPEGPLWYRGYVNDPAGSACAELSSALASLGAARMVVGHTTRRDGRIQSRCGGRLQVIDVGIADHYGGNLAAWVWQDGDARAFYAQGQTDLEDPS